MILYDKQEFTEKEKDNINNKMAIIEKEVRDSQHFQEILFYQYPINYNPLRKSVGVGIRQLKDFLEKENYNTFPDPKESVIYVSYESFNQDQYEPIYSLFETESEVLANRKIDQEYCEDEYQDMFNVKNYRGHKQLKKVKDDIFKQASKKPNQNIHSSELDESNLNKIGGNHGAFEEMCFEEIMFKREINFPCLSSTKVPIQNVPIQVVKEGDKFFDVDKNLTNKKLEAKERKREREMAAIKVDTDTENEEE